MNKLSRRRLLAIPAALAALAVPERVVAQTAGRINVEFCQETGAAWKLPPGRHNVVRWPIEAEAYPDLRGLMSEDRTEVTLADAGCYFVTWRITLGRIRGQDCKTSLECWDPADEAWHDIADGNEMAPTRGQNIDGYGPNETTLLGIAWPRSDGRHRIRVLAQHDDDDPVRVSDRGYECALHVAWWSD